MFGEDGVLQHQTRGLIEESYSSYVEEMDNPLGESGLPSKGSRGASWRILYENYNAGGNDMNEQPSVSEQLYDQFDVILKDLYRRTDAECVLLVDISGQLISTEGQLRQGDPVQVAALAAGDVAAMAELSRQIGERDPDGSFLHEGERKSLYLFNVDDSFILIVVFRSSRPVGLIRLFVRRAAERLHPLTDQFEQIMGQPVPVPTKEFSAGLATELEKAFDL
jgi:predicted regulator of Ras-like GTPase activity (Roadblock/LC7/MglB family)